MLSVLIETRNHEDGLARTLASLVGGAVEGMVREVIVCDAGSSDQTYRVAEHAGCRWLADARLAEGIRQARGEWLLFLEPGARLGDGWMGAVLDHVGRATEPAHFSRSRQSRGSFFSRLFSSGRPLAEGLVINRRQATAMARGHDTGATVARAVKARRLDAEIVVAPDAGNKA